MRIRSAAFGAATALSVLASGCGKDCSKQIPPLKNVQDCTVAEGAAVTVQIQACPRCDQGAPTCAVHLDNVASHSIQLEPLSDVCDPNGSCPIVDPASCSASPLSCTFTAPAASGSPYQVVVVTADGGTLDRTLTVGPAGTVASCAFPPL